MSLEPINTKAVQAADMAIPNEEMIDIVTGELVEHLPNVSYTSVHIDPTNEAGEVHYNGT